MWGAVLARAEDPAERRVHPALVHRTPRELERVIAMLDNGLRPRDGGDPRALRSALADNVAQLREQD